MKNDLEYYVGYACCIVVGLLLVIPYAIIRGLLESVVLIPNILKHYKQNQYERKIKNQVDDIMREDEPQRPIF
jgi:hypothetical protein|tara:strand:+ start:314 stop:532 length:219 start_codon:yes stop_codon:yes gene_type:complete